MSTSPITTSTIVPSLMRRRGNGPRLIAPGIAPSTTQTLPFRAGVAASVHGPSWMFIAGGAILGGLLFSLPGALLGGLGGYLLTR